MMTKLDLLRSHMEIERVAHTRLGTHMYAHTHMDGTKVGILHKRVKG